MYLQECPNNSFNVSDSAGSHLLVRWVEEGTITIVPINRALGGVANEGKDIPDQVVKWQAVQCCNSEER